MRRISAQQVPVSSVPEAAVTLPVRQAVVLSAPHVGEGSPATIMQPLPSGRVIRAQPEFVGYSPAQQMAQPCWPPMPAQVRYSVQPAQATVQQVATAPAKPAVSQVISPRGQLSLQAVPAVQAVRPGIPASYFSDASGMPVGDEISSFQQQQMEEQTFNDYQDGAYAPDEGYDGELLDERIQQGFYDEQVMEYMQDVQATVDGQASDNQGGNQFMHLLESLEARVDLMAQMQHTRAAIQKRAKAIEDARVLQSGHAIDEFGLLDRFSDDVVDTLSNGRQAQVYNGMSDEIMPYHQEQTLAVLPHGAANNLARENAELWSQMLDQKRLISKLTDEVEGMREVMSAIAPMQESASTATFSGPPTASPYAITGGPQSYPGSLGQDDLLAVLGRNDMGPLERLMASEGLARDVAGQDMRAQMRNLQAVCEGNAVDTERELLQTELLQERRRQELSAQQWEEERRRLYAEIDKAKSESFNSQGRSGFDATAPVLPLQRHSFEAGLGPFCQQSCGANLSLSEDCYTATRTRGCRQSVAIGSTPLELQGDGWFFEVVIGETVTGWVGGLGIGVTRTSPEGLRRVPDKAWRLPSTYIVGYWGCVFLDGRERRTRWRSDTLQDGSRVGVLVTAATGDLTIFVDDVPVVFAEGVIDRSREPLYPVVDVFAATRVIRLSRNAAPPRPPYKLEPKSLSPPGSPVSVSEGRSMHPNTASALEATWT